MLALGLAACGDAAEPTSSETATPTLTETTSEAPSVEPTATEPTTEPSTDPTTTEPSTPDPTTSEPTVEPTETPSEPPVVDDPVPATYDEARARFDAAGQEPVELRRFRTAADLYCVLDSDFVIGCELPAGGIPDPDYCGEGASPNVGRIEFPGPNAVCNSDTIREPGARLLGLDAVAGSSATGVQCLNEDIGITCIDPATSSGFFLGRDRYTTFGAG